jgi:hypothetical protein
MKATIGEAIGINGGSDEIDLLERRIEALNSKMLIMVNESISSGSDFEGQEDAFKEIADEMEQLNRRISAFRESQSDDDSLKERLSTIQNTINQREENKNTYDDSIVRQMIECIKVHHDGKLEIIFGGGYSMEEYLIAKK